MRLSIVGMDYSNIVSDCDAMIRAGQIEGAVVQLKKLNTALVPSNLRLSLASICRRADLVTMGLRLLTPVVYPEKGKVTKATFAEQAEYAILLQRSGAVREARQILESISPQDVPEVSLFLCACFFNVWDYAEAVPHFKTYIANQPSPYMGLVACVNLASALILTTNVEGAQELLLEIDKDSEHEGANRLRANCQEMLAQIHITQGHFSEARSALNQAADLLGRAETHDQLFMLKWKAILEGLETGSITPISAFRHLALARRESEAVRDADLYSLMIKFHPNLFEHLYFGTPFASYRQRICRILKRDPPQSIPYFGDPGAVARDLRYPISKIEFVILALVQDFYRPAHVGALFSSLFPGEHFNVFSSPGRVRQLLYRARKWIAEKKLPLSIEEQNGKYWLQASAPFRLNLPMPEAVLDSKLKHIEQLKTLFQANQIFSVKDAQAALGVSHATCKRVLQVAVEHNQIERFGAGKAIGYCFPESTLKRTD